MQKNVAGQKIGAQMVSATDGSAFSGSVTVYVTGDAGTQAVGSVGSGACTNKGNGYYTYAPAQAETNYDLISFTFIGTGAVPSSIQLTTAMDANLIKILGTAVSTPATAGILDINVKNMNNVAATPITTIKAVQGLATDGVVPTVTTVTNQLTAAQIATGIFQDTTAGDFTAANSIGKSIMNGVALGTGLTVASVSGAVGSVTARVTANADQLAGQTVTAAAGVTFPTSVASPTNITAGTITTVTNLTNAPTVGDFTSTMKTSIGTAVAGSAVASVTGNVGGNVTGSVGSVVAPVTVGTNSDKTGYTLTAAYDAAKTAAQAGDAMTLTSGERTSVGTAVWSSVTRTLSAFGFTVNTNANATETAIKTTTDQFVFTVPNQVDANALSGTVDAAGIRSAVGLASANLDTQLDAIPTDVENADAVLKRDWSLITGEASRSLLNAARFIRNRFSTTSTPGSVDVYKEDDTTLAYSKTVVTDSSAEPIVEG